MRKVIFNINMSKSLKEVKSTLSNYSMIYTVHVLKLTFLNKMFSGSESHYLKEISNFVDILKTTKDSKNNKYINIDAVSSSLYDNLKSEKDIEDVAIKLISMSNKSDKENYKLEQYIESNYKIIKQKFDRFTEFLIKQLKLYQNELIKLKLDPKKDISKINKLYNSYFTVDNFHDIIYN